MRRGSTSEPDPRGRGTVWFDGARIRWSDQQRKGPGGDTGDPPLLLISGLGGNIGMWKPLRGALAHRRTIAYDAPGTGDSTHLRRAPDMARLARVASRVLDAAGVEEVDVLGYSFGGFVAQELARRGPRVRRLILAGTTAGVAASAWDLRELLGPTSFLTPFAFGVMLTPGRYYLSPNGQRVVRAAFGDTSAHSYDIADRARARRPPSAVGYVHQLMATRSWSSREWLHELQMPTLVMSGSRDSVATVIAGRYLARHLPSARQAVVWRSGHSFLLRDDPSDSAALIDEFLGARADVAA